MMRRALGSLMMLAALVDALATMTAATKSSRPWWFRPPRHCPGARVTPLRRAASAPRSTARRAPAAAARRELFARFFHSRI